MLRYSLEKRPTGYEVFWTEAVGDGAEEIRCTKPQPEEYARALVDRLNTNPADPGARMVLKYFLEESVELRASPVFAAS